MGAVENMNKEVKNLIRCFVLMLKDVAKLDLHVNHPLTPWLVRHVGWCISTYRVRSDGRTGYERLKGRPYSGKIAMFGECLWYRTPDAMQLHTLDERWTTAIWVGKSYKSDEHIIIVGNEVRLARSVRRKAESKRWNRKMLENVLCTPWLPRLDPGTPAARPKRYITRAYLEKYKPTPECPGCAGRSTGHSDTCRARFQRIFEEEERIALAAGGPAPAGASDATGATAAADVSEAPAPAASAAAAEEVKSSAPVDNDKKEPWYQVTDVSTAAGASAPSASGAADVAMQGASGAKRTFEATQATQEAMEVEGNPTSPSGLAYHEKVELFESGSAFRAPGSTSASSKERRIGALSVCALRSPQEADNAPVPVCYVATPDIGKQVVYDARSGEALDPELVRQGRAVEKLNMQKLGLYDRVRVENARGCDGVQRLRPLGHLRWHPAAEVRQAHHLPGCYTA